MQIRAAQLEDAAAIARVHVDSWRAAYRDILPASFLDALSYEAREQRWREWWTQADPQRWLFVAEDDAGRIIGFAAGGPERDGIAGYGGEVYAIYLAPETFHRGIGRRLMAVCADKLIDQGFSAGLVWALEDNRSARAFYEALGGQLMGAKPVTIGGTPLTEVAYGWPDLCILLDARGEG